MLKCISAFKTRVKSATKTKCGSKTPLSGSTN